MIPSVTTHNPLSYQFIKWVFAVPLEDLREKDVVLEFSTPRFKFRPSAISKESTRNLLKFLDFDYPRDDKGNPVSYRDLSNKQMQSHIEWIIRQAGESGVELKHIREEWSRLMELNR